MDVVHESPTSRYFSLAVQQLLAREGRGAQADLARRAKVSPSYLNDLISGRKKYWPDFATYSCKIILGGKYTISFMCQNFFTLCRE